MTTTITDMTPDELRAELRTAREANRDFSTAATALAYYAREMKRGWDECRKSHDELYGIARQTEKDRDAAIARERALTEAARAHGAEVVKRLQGELAEAKSRTSWTLSANGDIEVGGKLIGVGLAKYETERQKVAVEIERMRRDIADAKGRTFTLCGDDNCRDGKAAFIKDGSGKIVGVTTERHESVLREGLRLAKLDHEEAAAANARCETLLADRNAADALNDELCSLFVAVPEWCKLPWVVTDDGIEDATKFMVVKLQNTRTARHIVACVNAMGAKRDGERPVTRAEGQEIAASHMATMEARRDKSRLFRVGDKVRVARKIMEIGGPGWVDEMTAMLGKDYVVQEITKHFGWVVLNGFSFESNSLDLIETTMPRKEHHVRP